GGGTGVAPGVLGGGGPGFAPASYPRLLSPPAARAPGRPGGFAPAPRRGGHLAGQGGAAINDFARYRLRPPPRGYAWVRVGGGFALVAEATGQVFDVVPN
uniref:RcnB family protein n=1 Tax=Phenylobacterium sp. TaxID=1871053 RepID=UPI00286CE46C